MKYFKYYYLLLALLVSFCVSSCGDKKDPSSGNETKRNIAIYMIATNSLSSSDENDLSEIESSILKNGMNNCRLLVYWVSKEAEPQLIEIKKNKNTVSRVCHKVYDSSIKSTTKARMKEVMADFVKTAPAKDYGLILWSHASGWASSLTARSSASLLDFGEDYGSTMPIDSLADALPSNTFSFIYTDACYMAGIEVAYELRNKTTYFIGSATELPIDGMDYTNNIPCFFADDVDLKKVCENTFVKYNIKSGSSRTCTISLVDCSQLDELAQLCKSIHANGTTITDVTDIQKYKRTVPYLFFDFVQYTKLLATEEQQLALDNLMDKVVTYKATTPYIFSSLAIDEANYSGLSTYIMGTTQSMGVNEMYYRTLMWYKDVISK